MQDSLPATGRIPRSGAVDFLRASAVIGVVLIHVSGPGLTNPVGSSDWFSALFWGSILRAAVPIFLMITGALMLDPGRDLSWKQLWGRKIARLLLALMVWAFVYRIWRMKFEWGGIPPGGWLDAVKQTLVFHHQNHLYYLHIALLIYALLPLLRILAAHADRRTLEYLLALWFLLGILYPTFQNIWPLTLLRGIPKQYMLNLAYSSMGYCLLGWYVRSYAKTPWKWAVTAVVGFTLVYGGTHVLSVMDGKLNAFLFEGTSLGVALLGAGICGWCFAVLQNKRVPFPITLLSRASFCIYLVHIIPLKELGRAGLHVNAGPCLFYAPLTALAVLGCSFGVWMVLSRIPWVRDWLI